MIEIATLIVATAGLLAALAAGWQSHRNAGEIQHNFIEIKNVYDEIRTADGLSMAQLADAVESRRVVDIPVDDRTVAEDVHLLVVPEKH